MTDTTSPIMVSHIPVLLQECIDALAIKPNGIYVDCTLGGGGHSEQIAKRLASGRLIAIDRDENAVAASRKRLSPYADRITFVHNNFSALPQILEDLQIPAVDGLLADLGVSSYQLDTPARGFSYQHDAPLDMRMDSRAPFSAYDVVNGYSEERLRRILFEYGEERLAARIAAEIVRRRAAKPISTTYELADAVRACYPAKLRADGHPAKRTFQAIRIEVNDELSIIAPTVDAMIRAAAPGGRIAVITFHSLEDRAVKEAMRRAQDPCTCPKDFPVCVCGKKPLVRVLTKKPITASEEELAQNHRAHSAKLRVCEKLADS